MKKWNGIINSIKLSEKIENGGNEDMKAKKRFLLAAAVMTVSSMTGVVMAEEVQTEAVQEAAAEEAVVADSEILTVLGTFRDDFGDISINSEYLYGEVGDNIQFYTPLGVKVENGDCLNVSRIGNFYVLARQGEILSAVGLFTEDGEQLLPYEAARIAKVSGCSDRYLEVTYVTGETDSEENGLLYTTDAAFTIGYDAERGDKLYSGSKKIYDTVNKQFVANIEITKSTEDVNAYGNSLVVTDAEGKKTMYDCNGNVMRDDMSMIKISGEYYVASLDSGYAVFDSDLQRLFDTPMRVYSIEGTEYFSYKNDNGNYCLMDKTGSLIFETQYTNELYSSGHPEIIKTVVYVNDDLKYGLLKADGTVLADGEYDSISYMGDGYFVGTKYGEDEDTYILIEENEGVISEELTEYFDTSHGTVHISYEDADAYFVVKDKDFTLRVEDGRAVGFNLVSNMDTASGKYGLIDTESGELVLDYEFTSIRESAGRIYAYKNGEYTVYQVNR